MKEVRVFFEPYGTLDIFDAEDMSEEEIENLAKEYLWDFLGSLDWGWEYVEEGE